jgi:hypothetical protein
MGISDHLMGAMAVHVSDSRNTYHCTGRLKKLIGGDDGDSFIILTDIVSPLVSRSLSQSSRLTISEVASILLALSQFRNTRNDMNSQYYKPVFVLSRRFANTNDQKETDLEETTPQDAATILYALGRMNLRDDDVFRNLSNLMSDKIGSASAQALANVLYAHREVLIKSPQQLLDRWAVQKIRFRWRTR